MKIKKTKILFLLFIILVLCNVGCKNQRETPEQQKERESAEPDRQTSMFTASDELKVEETYYLNDFSRWEHYIDSDNMEEAAEIQTDGNGRYSWFLGVKCNENKDMTQVRMPYIYWRYIVMIMTARLVAIMQEILIAVIAAAMLRA